MPQSQQRRPKICRWSMILTADVVDSACEPAACSPHCRNRPAQGGCNRHAELRCTEPGGRRHSDNTSKHSAARPLLFPPSSAMCRCVMPPPVQSAGTKPLASSHTITHGVPSVYTLRHVPFLGVCRLGPRGYIATDGSCIYLGLRHLQLAISTGRRPATRN